MTSFIELADLTVRSFHEDFEVFNSAFGPMREEMYNHILRYIRKEINKEKKKMYKWFGFYSSAIKKERVSQARELLDLVTTSLDADMISSANRIICTARRGLLNRSSLLDTIARYIQNMYVIENQLLKHHCNTLQADFNNIENNLNNLQVDCETVEVQKQTLEKQVKQLNEGYLYTTIDLETVNDADHNLKEQMEKLQLDYEPLGQENQALKTNLENLQKQLENLRVENRNLEGTLNTIAPKYKKLKQEYKNLNKKYRAEKNEEETLLTARLAKLKSSTNGENSSTNDLDTSFDDGDVNGDASQEL